MKNIEETCYCCSGLLPVGVEDCVCNPNHTCSDVNTFEFNGAYSRISGVSIATQWITPKTWWGSYNCMFMQKSSR